MKITRLISLFSVAALATGCSDAASAGRFYDCTANGTCAPLATNLTLAAELLPPAESALGRTEFAQVLFDGAATAKLALPARVAVPGRVVDEAEQQSVTALVTATRPSLINGLSAVTRSTTTGSNGFTIDLTEGQWVLRVVPQGSSAKRFPPETRTVDVTSGMAPLGITLSAARTLAGQVNSAFGQPIPGVTVRVIDAATSTLISSESTTNDAGEFSVALSSDTAQRDAVVLTAQGGGLPVTLQRVFDGKSAVAVMTVVLRAPALPAPLPYRIPIVGKAPSGAEQKVVGARVEVSGDLTEKGSDTALFSASAVSDSDGIVNIALVPAAPGTRSYTAVVSPAADSLFVSGHFPVPVGDTAGSLQQISLDARPAVRGQVVGPDGQPVGGAIVAAQPAATLGMAAALANGLALPQVVADSKDGRFLLRLGIGTYDLQITPPWGSGLALWSLDNVVVTGDADLGEVPLPRASSAMVVIRDDGQPAPSVEIRLYSDVVTGQCPLDKGCRRPRLRADVTTGSDGVARVLLGTP